MDKRNNLYLYCLFLYFFSGMKFSQRGAVTARRIKQTKLFKCLKFLVIVSVFSKLIWKKKFQEEREKYKVYEHQCGETTPVSSSDIAPAMPCLDSTPPRDVESVLSKAEPQISAKTDSDLSRKTPPLPRRGLNINKYCVKCNKRHPVWQKCQCQLESPT